MLGYSDAGSFQRLYDVDEDAVVLARYVALESGENARRRFRFEELLSNVFSRHRDVFRKRRR